MSKYKEKPLGDAWDDLSRQVQTGRPQPSTLPERLPLNKIRLCPSVFQHRGRRDFVGEAHVRELAAAIKKSRSQTVSPVKVWWDGKGWACIDGHHRLDAYRAAGVGASHQVPVEVFAGTLAQAVGEAASANTKGKLPMSRAERSNTAWRLVVTTSMSKEETASAACVSEATIAIMRRVRNQLEARNAGVVDSFGLPEGVDYRGLSWLEARRLVDGREAPDLDRDAANETKAQEMAMALHKALGKEGGKYPEILARAIEIYDARLLDRLIDWCSEREEPASEEAEQALEASEA